MIQYKIIEFVMHFDITDIINTCVDNKIFNTRKEANEYRLSKLNYINMAIVEFENDK